MKDIKLTIEDIKKGCEFADGYHCTNTLGRRTIYTPCGAFAFTSNKPLDSYFWKGAGSLFLDRTIEGIIKSKKGFITSNYFVYEASINFNDSELFDIDWDNIDQAKTNAIKYILDKIK